MVLVDTSESRKLSSFEVFITVFITIEKQRDSSANYNTHLQSWVENTAWPLPHQLGPCHTNTGFLSLLATSTLTLWLTTLCFGHINYGNDSPLLLALSVVTGHINFHHAVAASFLKNQSSLFFEFSNTLSSLKS